MGLLCRKWVLKRTRLAEGEDRASPGAEHSRPAQVGRAALLGTALQRWSREEVQGPLLLPWWAL